MFLSQITMPEGSKAVLTGLTERTVSVRVQLGKEPSDDQVYETVVEFRVTGSAGDQHHRGDMLKCEVNGRKCALQVESTALELNPRELMGGDSAVVGTYSARLYEVRDVA